MDKKVILESLNKIYKELKDAYEDAVGAADKDTLTDLEALQAAAAT